MDRAVQYVENMNQFVSTLLGVARNVEVKKGRRFDRVFVDGTIKYFVDKESWTIYGAKSALQFNPRREFGKVDTVTQFNWTTGTPLAGSSIEAVWMERENAIVSGYKKRGRPRKSAP